MNTLPDNHVSPPPLARCDVAIVGGGLVGASLACALAPLGLRVALLEAVPLRAAGQPSYDDRTLALSGSSCRILQGLGIWPALGANATAIREIRVTERNRPGQVVMKPQELGLENFGHVVEARVFGAAVLELLSGMGGVELICLAKVTAIETTQESVRIAFQRDGQEHGLQARLLVGADGAESVVRTALGITAERHDYGQTAIVCNVTPEKAHLGCAYECFTPTGPFALMPHVNGRCGLVWSVASEDAARHMEMPEQHFLQHAHDMFGNALGPWLKLGKRSAYPLRLVRATVDTGLRSLLLGNAAHAIHPVGAQGFNLGLRDVAVLAEVLADALAQNPAADIGAAALLQSYSNWRAPDQAGTIGYSDGLARLYANPSALASIARGFGMLAHALVPPLRRQLAIRAMGYRGRVPRLALGESLVSR